MRLAALFLAVGVLVMLPRASAGQQLSPELRFVEVEVPRLYLMSTAPELQASALDRRFVVWGMVAGAAAGAIWGVVLMKNTEDWLAPPAYVVTVPVGVLVGGGVGWLFGKIASD